MNKSMVLAATCLLTTAWPMLANAQSATTSNNTDVTSQIESMRADARADKVLLITDVMNFTPQESALFWPIYKKYESELSELNNGRVDLIRSYAEKYATLTDADAKQMSEKAFDFEKRRVELKEKYFKEFNKQLSATTTAKFFQLEHRLDLLVDASIASQLPPLLAKPAATTSGAAAPQ